MTKLTQAGVEVLFKEKKSIRKKIDNFKEYYKKMMDFGEDLTSKNTQYMIMCERLKAPLVNVAIVRTERRTEQHIRDGKPVHNAYRVRPDGQQGRFQLGLQSINVTLADRCELRGEEGVANKISNSKLGELCQIILTRTRLPIESSASFSPTVRITFARAGDTLWQSFSIISCPDCTRKARQCASAVWASSSEVAVTKPYVL
uniref:Uncharacterized protein n=1 Tax=Anopheles melas TaxID=34690 RepID=A0A182U6Y5_9DIPT